MGKRLGVVLTLVLGAWGATAVGQEPDHGKALVEKAVKALGDADKQKLAGITFDSKAKVMDGNANIDFTGSWSVLGYDKINANLNINANGNQKAALVVVSGMQVWAQEGDTGKTETAPEGVVPSILGVFRSVRLAQRPGLLLHKDFKLSALGELLVNNVACMGVKIEQKGYKDLSLYFDKATGLPAKADVLIKGNPNANEETFVFLFSEFKETDGVKHFTKIAIQKNNTTMMEVELSNLRPVAEVNANLFMKP